MTARTASAAVLVAGLFVLHAPSLVADDESFKKGMKAFDDKKWTEAIRFFLEAIGNDAKESATRKIGGLFSKDPYLPYRYLGEAYYQQGRCREALNSWDQSQMQPEIAKVKDALARVKALSAECEKKGFLLREKLDSEYQRVRLIINSVDAVAKEVAAARGANPDSIGADLRGRFNDTQATPGLLRRRLDEARESRQEHEFVVVAEAAERSRREAGALLLVISGAADGATQIAARLDEMQQQLAGVDRADGDVRTQLSESPLKGRASPALIDTAQRASDGLRRAHTGLEAARRTKTETDMTEARRLITETSGVFARLKDELEKERAAIAGAEMKTLRTSLLSATTALESRFATTRSTANQVVAGERPRVEALLTPLERRLARLKTRQQSARASATELQNMDKERALIATQLDAVIPVIDALVPVTIPDVLKRAAQSFLDGRYGDALDALPESTAASLDARLKPHAFAFRAASALALYQYSGGKDEARLREAERAVVAAKAAQPEFRPEPSVFGPKFRAFFEQPGVR